MTQPPSSPRSQEIFRALSLLKPYDTPALAKIRVGPQHDGGYIMFDDLDTVAAAYSFGIGIGDQVGFDAQLADAGKQIYMFDHTIGGVERFHPNFNFFREGIAGVNDPALSMFTLEHHVAARGHSCRTDLVLKIDVEGAEYDALIATPLETLKQFRQFVLELHWLSRLGDPEFRSKFIAMLEKINTVFSLCHVHANNCVPLLVVVDGYVVADVLELSYVRSDLVEARPSRTVYPCEIDHANNPRSADHLLWFYPFLPMGLVDETLAESAIRASLAASEQTVRAYRTRLHLERIVQLEAELESLRGQELPIS